MPAIRVHDKLFEPYIPASTIHEKVGSLGETLSRDYEGKKPLFIPVLNGAFMFAGDLFRALTIEAEICFIKLASYKGTKSTGHVVTAIGLDIDLYARHVVIVEDIVDTGKTLVEFLPQLLHQQPASLKIVTLLYKRGATVHPIDPEYVGFSIPNRFVVGYGLDYDGLGRNLGEIYIQSSES
jgi:hypoxanthine phosphoribosyltransferase